MGEFGAVFVNQMRRSGQVGPVAAWITIAGWAAAAERRYGRAWMVTPDGVLDPPTGTRAGVAARPSADVAVARGAVGCPSRR